MLSRYFQVTVLALTIFMGTLATVSASGISSEGFVVAKKWCANCHLVWEEQATAMADAPSFREIATKHQSTLDALGAFLADPHPVMPNFNLSRREIRDLLAYIESLR